MWTKKENNMETAINKIGKYRINLIKDTEPSIQTIIIYGGDDFADPYWTIKIGYRTVISSDRSMHDLPKRVQDYIDKLVELN